MKKTSGFSLIELTIVVAIVAVLSMIAAGFYRDNVIASNRTEARATQDPVHRGEGSFDSLIVQLDEKSVPKNRWPEYSLATGAFEPLWGLRVQPTRRLNPLAFVSPGRRGDEASEFAKKLWDDIVRGSDFQPAEEVIEGAEEH